MRRKTLVLGIALACGLLGASAFSLGRPTSPSQANGGGPVVVATIPVGSSPLGVAVSPDRNRIYVTNDLGSVSVIDGTSNMVVATVAVGTDPWGVAVNPNTNRIYVTNLFDGTVSVIEDAPPATATPTATATSEPVPHRHAPKATMTATATATATPTATRQITPPAPSATPSGLGRRAVAAPNTGSGTSGGTAAWTYGMAAAAAGIVALGGAAWYARRRRLT